MTRVIKAGMAPAGLILAPLSGSDRLREPVAPEPVPANPLLREIEQLRAALAEREAEIAGHAVALAAARAEGEAAGREAAELDFAADHAAALERLEDGIAAAQAELAKAMPMAEALALLALREALDKLFGDPARYHDLIAGLLNRQLDRIGRELTIAVEVSRLDFPDTRDLASLAEATGLGTERLKAQIDLPQGACRMKLRLGTLDLGIDRQWSAVRALLDEFALAESEAEG